MKTKSSFLLATSAALAVLLFAGCTTKSYVRKQAAPLINRVNDLDAQTAKNANNIKDVDARGKQGLAAVNASTQQAVEKAQAATTDANRVSQQLTQTSHQITSLSATVANLDDYQLNSQNVVHFGFDKWSLTPESQGTLDQVVGQLNQDAHAILEVEGYTDSTGPTAYNYTLSQRRADSVVRYLEEKGLPPHRIFLIGLGENQSVASNATSAGRSQNRRVELKVLVNALAKSAGSQGSVANR